MKQGITRYIDNAQRGLNASGEFRNTVGQFMPSRPSGWNAASGQQTGMAAPTSQPFILTITNASAGAVANFDIFGANTYLYGDFGTYSTTSWTYQNVTVTSNISNTTYRALLSQLNSKPIAVAQTRLVYTGGNTQILTNPVTFNYINQDGEFAGRPLIFQLNSFQNVSTQVDNFQEYTIDSNSKLTFSSIPANTGFNVLIYPKQSIDLTASLVGAPVANNYGNPRLNQQSVTLR